MSHIKFKLRAFIIEVIGWYGACAMLLAYALVSFDVIQPDSFLFQFLNFTAAIGIVTISVYKKVYQVAVIDTFWAIIALIALINILFF